MATKSPPKKSKVKQPIKVSSKFKREVDFKINERAKAVKQDRIVHALTEKIQQGLLMEPYRNKMKQLTEEVERLRAECEASTEKREVYCIKEYDFAHQEVRVRRVDTREVVETTTMTDEDRQEMLPHTTSGRPAKDEPEPGKPPAQAIREAREARGELKVVPDEGAEAPATDDDDGADEGATPGN